MERKDFGPHTPEHQSDIAHERSRELEQESTRHPERYNENEAHYTAEKARSEALKEALLSKEQGKEKRTHQAERHNASHVITPQQREASFEQTMEHVRKALPRRSRGFSGFIHQANVERTSEFLGKTIARPNAILAGGICAFVVVLALYSYAKFAGFSLSGSETIIAFMAGWTVGLLFDLVRSLLGSRD
jgi:hypothetical protein